MNQDTQQQTDPGALIMEAIDRAQQDEHTQLIDQAVNIARELSDATNAAIDPIIKRQNDDGTQVRAVLGGLASYAEHIMGAALSNLYENGVPMDTVEDTAKEIAENAMGSVREGAGVADADADTDAA